MKTHNIKLSNKIYRAVWSIFYFIFFRFTPTPLFGLRRFYLTLFGAKLGKNTNIYPSVKIWAPWNLTMKDGSCLASNVDCYNVGEVFIGKNSTVSQYSYICTASHDYNSQKHELIVGKVVIEDNVWIAADVFIGCDLIVAEGSVILARSVNTSNTIPWSVYFGNPAEKISNRQKV